MVEHGALLYPVAPLEAPPVGKRDERAHGNFTL
jgi:hypothetical protein